MSSFNFEFNSEEIMGATIRKSKNYSYASVYVNREGHYIDINYEWEGDEIPDFAMDILSFIGNKETSSENKKEIAKFQKRIKCL